jgi:RNA polymerase sigma factor (TIGR02999 family)
MRRILIEAARKRNRVKRGGGLIRVDLDDAPIKAPVEANELLALDKALTELEIHDPQAASLVKLRYFAGLTHHQAAEALGIGRRTADRLWALARVWLLKRIGEP